MPRRLLRVSLIALAALAVLLPAAALTAQEAAPVTLLVFHRPPYYILKDGKPAGGFLLTAALLVFEKAGIPVTVREMPPGRIIATLTDNKIQACGVGWFNTPQREAFARVSLPLYQDQPLAVAVGSSARGIPTEPPPTLGDLLRTEKTWGLREGFSYGKEADQAFLQYPANRVKRFSDTHHMVTLLAQGRLDALLIDPEELSWIVASQPDLGPKIRLVPLAGVPPGADRHILCSQAISPEVMARLDTAIRAIAPTQQYRDLTTFSYPYK